MARDGLDCSGWGGEQLSGCCVHGVEFSGSLTCGNFWTSWGAFTVSRQTLVLALRNFCDGDVTNHYSCFSAVRRPSAYAGRSVSCLQVRVVSTYVTGANWHQALGSRIRELLAACPWWSRRVQLWFETDTIAVLRSFKYSAEGDLRCYLCCRSLLFSFDPAHQFVRLFLIFHIPSILSLQYWFILSI